MLVVDDASSDNTQELARKAGAVVVRNSHSRGRTAAHRAGRVRDCDARRAGRRAAGASCCSTGGLGSFAIGAAPLVPAVTEGVCDMAIALTDIKPISTGPTAKAARRAIEVATHWTPLQPLSRIRCVSRDALEAAMPLVARRGARGGAHARRARGRILGHGARVRDPPQAALRATTVRSARASTSTVTSCLPSDRAALRASPRTLATPLATRCTR